MGKYSIALISWKGHVWPILSNLIRKASLAFLCDHSCGPFLGPGHSSHPSGLAFLSGHSYGPLLGPEHRLDPSGHHSTLHYFPKMGITLLRSYRVNSQT